MTVTIWEWPDDWYQYIVSSSFNLKKISLAAPHRWTGSVSVSGPIAHAWTAKLTLAPMLWDTQGQAVAAFFDRLDGQAGYLRIGDAMRRVPLRDRLLTASSEAWSDSTYFSDSSGWVSGLLSPTVYVASAATKGATTLVIAGLPVSTASVLRPGDLIELRPSGIATDTPNLYTVIRDAPTDASGATGLEIRPPLRQSFMAGDMVVLTNPTSVFMLADDDQGASEITGSQISSTGFSLIEKII